MKRKLLIVFGGSIAILAISLIVLQTQTVFARKNSLRDILFPHNPPPQMIQMTPTKSVENPTPTATLFPEGMPDLPTQESVVVIVNSEQMKKNDEVLENVRNLIEKKENVYLSAGWVHTTTITERFTSNSETLPDGSPIPMKWTTDKWLLLDEDGYVVQGISIQDTGSSVTSQVSKYENGEWINITLGTTSRVGKYRPIDGIFTQLVADKNMFELEVDDGTFSDKEVKVFTAIQRNYKPFMAVNSDYPVMGIVFKYYISTENGSIFAMEQYIITTDSEYKLTKRIVTTENSKIDQPPSEILQYFK